MLTFWQTVDILKHTRKLMMLDLIVKMSLTQGTLRLILYTEWLRCHACPILAETLIRAHSQVISVHAYWTANDGNTWKTYRLKIMCFL